MPVTFTTGTSAHAAQLAQCAALERKQAEIEAFAYTVAHDLKAPLGAIEITADGLLDREVAETMRSDVVRILRLAGETENMIVDLLPMVRIVSEPEPVESVDLGAVTAQGLEVLLPDIAARNVEVDVTTPLPTIPRRAMKLRHVVANLVGNAIRFVPPGTGRIGVSGARDGASVVLAVCDSGVGIVETHGGEVWVESAPGVGSVFRVRLPAGRSGPGLSTPASSCPVPHKVCASQQSSERIGWYAGVLQHLRQELRAHTFGFVQGEQQGSPVRMGEKPMAAAPPDLHEARAQKRPQHTSGGELGQSRHVR